MKKYARALSLGVLTAVLCLAVADGVFGLEGRITNWTNLGGGDYGYTLDIHDNTGRMIFWVSLIGLPVVFCRWVGAKETLVNVPVYVVSWYVFSACFGRHANHGILDHPAQGFLEIGTEFEPFLTALAMWGIQALVLILARRIFKRT